MWVRDPQEEACALHYRDGWETPSGSGRPSGPWEAAFPGHQVGFLSAPPVPSPSVWQGPLPRRGTFLWERPSWGAGGSVSLLRNFRRQSEQSRNLCRCLFNGRILITRPGRHPDERAKVFGLDKLLKE